MERKKPQAWADGDWGNEGWEAAIKRLFLLLMGKEQRRASDVGRAIV